MKMFKIMFAMLFAFVTCQSVNAQSNKLDHVKDVKDSITLVQYVCPMHPDVTSDKPGKCSKCGMDLNLLKKEQMKADVVKYTCPMHPEVTSYKPGKCSKCGMTLTQIKTKKG